MLKFSTASWSSQVSTTFKLLAGKAGTSTGEWLGALVLKEIACLGQVLIYRANKIWLTICSLSQSSLQIIPFRRYWEKLIQIKLQYTALLASVTSTCMQTLLYILFIYRLVHHIYNIYCRSAVQFTVLMHVVYMMHGRLGIPCINWQVTMRGLLPMGLAVASKSSCRVLQMTCSKTQPVDSWLDL